MGTGVLSSLAHAFPYGGPYNPALRGLFMFFFMTNFVFFLLIGGATIARYIMFPEASFYSLCVTSLSLTSLIGMGQDDYAPCAEHVPRCFPYGLCNSHQRRPCESSRSSWNNELISGC